MRMCCSKKCFLHFSVIAFYSTCSSVLGPRVSSVVNTFHHSVSQQEVLLLLIDRWADAQKLRMPRDTGLGKSTGGFMSFVWLAKLSKAWYIHHFTSHRSGRVSPDRLNNNGGSQDVEVRDKSSKRGTFLEGFFLKIWPTFSLIVAITSGPQIMCHYNVDEML